MADVFALIEQQVAIFIRRAEYARQSKEGVEALERSAYLLLTYLYQHGQTTVGTLADVLQLDISTASRQIAALAKKGYVVRSASEEDKRVSVVRMSDEGHAQLEQARKSRNQIYRELLEGWTAEEKDTFLLLLTRLNDRIKVREASRRKL